MYSAIVRGLPTLIVAALLSACGGGGDVNFTISPTFPPLFPPVGNTDFIARENFAFNLNGAGRDRLVLSGINGKIEITGDLVGSGIAITGQREVGAASLADAQAQLPALQVDVQEVGAEVVVRTIQPLTTGGRSYIVNYRIRLPASLAVSIANVNGGLELNGMNGGVDASLVNGQTEARLAVPSGGSVRLKGVNGNIDLHLPLATSAVFSAQVGIGTITLTDLALQNEVRTGTSLRGLLGTGNGTVTLETGNGSIRVDAAP